MPTKTDTATVEVARLALIARRTANYTPRTAGGNVTKNGAEANGKAQGLVLALATLLSTGAYEINEAVTHVLNNLDDFRVDAAAAEAVIARVEAR